MVEYPDEETTEYSDEEEAAEFMQEQRENAEETQQYDTLGNYPVSKKPESLFSLFKDVWKTNNSSKIANLEKDELGNLGISVRDSQRIGLLANTLHHPGFANYFNGTGEITLSTSMSKKGWFVEMFVTSKKFAQKGNISNILGQPKPQQKWRIFQNKQPEA